MLLAILIDRGLDEVVAGKCKAWLVKDGRAGRHPVSPLGHNPEGFHNHPQVIGKSILLWAQASKEQNFAKRLLEANPVLVCLRVLCVYGVVTRKEDVG